MYAKIALTLAFAALPPSTARAQLPRFTIDTAQAKHAGASLIGLTAAGALRIDDGGEKKGVARLIELRQDGRALPPILTRDFALLTNGDRIPLDPNAPASLADNKLKIWPAASLPSWREAGLTLFAPHVVLLFWTLPDGVDEPEPFFLKLAREPRPRDVVYLKNGDRIEGTLATLDAKTGCTIEATGRKLTTPWADIAGIAWNTERLARPRSRGAYTRAVLDGGARLNLAEIRFDEKTRRWHGKTQFGAALELSESSVLALHARQGLAVELSDLTPKTYEQRAYLGSPWPLAKDAAANGVVLRVGSSSFEKGLGTHAPCRITYALDGKYQRFDAVVGIDERTSRRGRAKIALEIDGKRIDLNTGKELTSQSAPVEVRQDVRGAKTLTLIVDLGSFGDVQANVNWANARLIKRE